METAHSQNTPAHQHHRAGNSNYAKFSLETWPTLLTVRNKLATDFVTSHGGVLFFKHASCVSFLFIVIILIFSQPLAWIQVSDFSEAKHSKN